MGSNPTSTATQPRCHPTDLHVCAAEAKQGALDLLADKVAAFERGLDLELTPDIKLIAYLRWWTDVELIEQVEDGLITATMLAAPRSGALMGKRSFGNVAGLHAGPDAVTLTAPGAHNGPIILRRRSGRA